MNVNFRFFLIVLLSGFIAESFATAGNIELIKTINIAHSERQEGELQLSYNSIDKNFFIAWIDRLWGEDEIESRIRARIMKPDGSLSATRIYQKGYGELGLFMCHDPQHNQFLMIWNGSPTIDYRLLSSNGGVRKAGRVKGELSTAITYHPLTAEYLIATPLQRLSHNAMPLGKASDKDFAAAVIIPDANSTNYFLFFSDLEGTIFFQILRSDGTSLTSARAFLRNWGNFSVAFNPSQREFLVVYSSPFKQWRALKLNEHGVRIGSPVILANKPESWSSVIFYIDHFFVAYNQNNRIFLRELDANARPLNSPIPLTDEGEFATDFQLASSEGRNFAIVWSQEDIDGVLPETSYDIFARLFRLP